MLTIRKNALGIQNIMSEPKEQDVIAPAVSFLQPGIETRIDMVCRLIGGRPAAAAAAGVSEPMLRRYIRGDSKPTFEVVVNLAGAAGVELSWVATGTGPMRKGEGVPEAAPNSVEASPCVCLDTLGNPVDLAEFVFIPRYNLKAAAGHGASTEGEKPVFSMAFRKYWIEHYLRAGPKDLSVLSVKGDSMEGVLNDRDVILVNHAENEPGTGLFVLRMDGDLIVKRVQRLPGGRLEVKSANEAYSPFEVDLNKPSGDFAIIGRVVWYGRQI